MLVAAILKSETPERIKIKSGKLKHALQTSYGTTEYLQSLILHNRLHFAPFVKTEALLYTLLHLLSTSS